jgi:putative addiction module component (TIGR02574 family)
MKVSAADTLDLPVAERIKLVAEIWDSVAAFPDEIEITEPTRKLIRKRLEAHRADPNSGSPWEEVKNRILSR